MPLSETPRPDSPIAPHLRLETHPVAHPDNVVTGENFRITVLDAGLVRLEYSVSGVFEDRASQLVVDRSFAPTDFRVDESDNGLEIHTDRLYLSYDRGPFTTEGLSVQAKGGIRSHESLWRYGTQPHTNLGGTARTLDEVDGPCPLEPGVVSAGGIAVVDDSASVLLTDDGWIAPRIAGNVDLYVFAYERDYRAALAALYRLAGRTPLLPRHTLGNWWSRYHPYSAEEYLRLMDRFDAEDVPFSVAVIDMDWHWVEIDPRYGSGWTGYSWNTDLFPDPRAFLGELHDRGLAVSLNVHPAEGVHAHEERYPAMAKRMGVDHESELAIPFDPTSPEFLAAYLEELHHPLEDAGVDFWWLDWQQGGVTKIPGLDPLWLLNHFHFLDSGRGGRRPLTFSRYAGVGSHRYPVGFSGDTVISWESLRFQPYFTATASNVGYGWWSHDIGGHFFGYKDDELATRWVQLGTFSPILRLHSSLSRYLTKEPWRYDERAERVMKDYLRLRHQLVPYLYTMNVRAHQDGEPLVQPMYYDHPWDDAAYAVPNQFMFGDRLMVAPITTPAECASGLARVTAWLPPGDWVDMLTGLAYRGGRTIMLHRDLDSIPVFAKAGAILPLTAADAVAGTANPERLEIRIFAGADGSFTLVEDGDDQRWARTPISYDSTTGDVVIGPLDGDPSSVPAQREYDLVLCGFARVDGVGDAELDPGPVPGSVRARLGRHPVAEAVTVQVRGDRSLARNEIGVRAFTLVDRANIPFADKDAIDSALAADEAVSSLLALGVNEPLVGALVEMLLAR